MTWSFNPILSNHYHFNPNLSIPLSDWSKNSKYDVFNFYLGGLSKNLFMQIKESSELYDVIIVGSGAGGGMATKQLADAGLNVAVVEAGPFFDPRIQNK